MLIGCYGPAGEQSCRRLILIARYIKEHRGCTPEEICRGLEMPYGDVAAAVQLLESDGFITIDLLQRCCIDSKKTYICA